MSEGTEGKAKGILYSDSQQGLFERLEPSLPVGIYRVFCKELEESLPVDGKGNENHVNENKKR